MTRPKKKKTKVHHLEKVAKAQHRNEYIRKLQKVLHAIGCDHVTSLFPPGELDLLYHLRCQTINITIAPGDFMPPGKLKWIRRLLSAMLKRYQVQLLPNGGYVDLDTYFTAGITLLMYGNVLDFDNYPKAAQVKEALMPYLLDKKYKNQAYVHLRQIADTISLMMSDLTRRIYWATVKLSMAKPDINSAYHMVWHSAVPEKIHVPVKNEIHTAWRLGIARYQVGPEWVTIKAGSTLDGNETHKDVRVYVQSHVLKRLYERIDCISRESVFLEFLKSFENLQSRYDDQREAIFIDLRLYNVKVGYLLATLVKNKLIVRTFLFITQTGSPEGDVLRRNARLKKDEITFLELDHLSTFMTPEMQANKHIKQFFAESGMKPIFDLFKILKDKNITITKHANTTLIEDYLGIDLTREFLDEEEATEEDDDGNENNNDEEPDDEDSQTDETLTETLADFSEDSPPDEEAPPTPKPKLWFRILVWLLFPVVMPLIWLAWLYIKYIVKRKKKDASAIDYKQFLTGRKRKKKK